MVCQIQGGINQEKSRDLLTDYNNTFIHFNSLHAGKNFMLQLSSADFFKINFFQNFLSGTLSEYQMVWIQVRDH